MSSQQASNERRYDRVRRGTLQPDQDDGTGTSHEANSVSPVNHLTTTKAGKPRKRIIWTDEMNMNVMRCYYLSTRLETIRTGYRDEFLRLFLTIYPQISSNITAQRLADQKRYILSSNKITLTILERIKEEVAIQINGTTTNNTIMERQSENITITQNIQDQHELHQVRNENLFEYRNQSANQTSNTNNTLPRDMPNTQQNPESPATNVNQYSEMRQRIYITLQENITKWKEVEATMRAPLPKLIIKNDTHKMIHIMNNDILKEICVNVTNLQDFHTLLYSAASTILQLNKQNITRDLNRIPPKNKPKWQIRLENKINTIRRKLGRLTQYNNGNRSKKIIKHIKGITENNIENTQEITDIYKQKLAVYSARLRRYNESYKRKIDNKNFINNEKLFYRKLTESNINIVPPTKEQITNFWKNIWSIPSKHKENSTWIDKEEQRYGNVTQQNNVLITTDELSGIIKHTHSWKCPGVDYLSNYWYKTFSSTHTKLKDIINELIQNPDNCPDFLTEGITFIKPKNENTQNPANYRPITCLPTIYKIITSLISNKIYKHLMENNILTNEQKGCRKWSQGCKEQLIIDTVIMQQASKEKRNLYTSYIDYRKAYDMVPHSWLMHILKLYKVHPTFMNFLRNMMMKWRTHIMLRTKTDIIKTSKIQIKRGIFQGDALSALWFCMCINPLSNILKDTPYGFKIKHNKIVKSKINHLLYMDDIKLYASTQAELIQLLNTTSQISADMRMEFGTDKCKTQHIERGQWIAMEQITTINNEAITSMEKNETYKYLGIQQDTRIDHTKIKNELRNQLVKRLKTLLKTQLNSRNQFKAINTYVIPILTYSFGIIKWTNTDLQNIEIIIRKMLTQFRKHHPKSCKERLTLPRSHGGRGLIDIKVLHNEQRRNLREYFRTNQSTLHKAIVLADMGYTPLNLSENDEAILTPTLQEKITSWITKEIHGKHPRLIQDVNVDSKNSYSWLKRGELQPETEGFNIAIQDQVIATRNYLKYIVKDEKVTNDKCRKCHLATENIDHIISGCQILVGTSYTERHNNVAKIIHQHILNNQLNETNNLPYYQYHPVAIAENENFKVYWDTTIQTDRTIGNNRPDITLLDKRQKTTYIIEISVPSDNNIQRKYIEKLTKYEELTAEIKRIWKQKSVIILPFIISATGILHKMFTPNLAVINIPEIVHSKIQKAVILKTCNIVRSFLNTSEVGYE